MCVRGWVCVCMRKKERKKEKKERKKERVRMTVWKERCNRHSGKSDDKYAPY